MEREVVELIINKYGSDKPFFREHQRVIIRALLKDLSEDEYERQKQCKSIVDALNGETDMTIFLVHNRHLKNTCAAYASMVGGFNNALPFMLNLKISIRNISKRLAEELDQGVN